jgi:hypothetical protein
VVKINDAIDALNWAEVMVTPSGRAVPVCAATVNEWEAYVESEDQTLKSKHTEWLHGKVWIVGLPSEIQDRASHPVLQKSVAI